MASQQQNKRLQLSNIENMASATATAPLGPAPSPTWLATVQILTKQIQEFKNNNKIKITGISPALSSALNTSTKLLPSAFFAKTLGKEHSLAVQCELLGEPGTPLENGIWNLEVCFPVEFPWKPPTFHITTPFFHPDVPLPDSEKNKTAYKIKSTLFPSSFDQSGKDAGKENKTDEALLHRLQVAKDRLAPFVRKTSSEHKAPTLSHLAPTTTTVSIVGFDQSHHTVSISVHDTVAGLKLRCIALTHWQFSNEDLVCKGQVLMDASKLVEHDIIYVVRRKYEGPYGPFASNEGKCAARPNTGIDTNIDTNLRCFSFDINRVHGAIKWLDGVYEMRTWLHTSHVAMRKEMMINAGCEYLKVWNPFVALYNRDKVRNLKAGVLLAEGKMNEYEGAMKVFTLKYATPRVLIPPSPPIRQQLAISPPPPPPPLTTNSENVHR
jgi:hypothetical protein